ncbi:MAG: TolC family protein [Deltaproteobacteria bacterium]|nr:MAG: TolC family protein [Deltaproteobacteria bacterium]
MLWWWLAAALASPLTLDTLLDAVDARVPVLAEAEAGLEAAEAKRFGARGAFDPKLSAAGGAYTGKYPREYADVGIKAHTPLGMGLEAGYRVGTGDFPTYDERTTADQGELRVGVSLPLLDGLWLGEARGVAMDAELVVRAKQASLDDKRVAARVKAEASWWKWVAAGEKRRIAEAQLALAEQRDGALRTQVREGAKSQLDLLDNERVLFERRADLAAAERALDVAAVELSLWWRDVDGAPVVPTDEELPRLPEPAAAEVTEGMALERPDLLALRAEVGRAELGQRLANNRLLPTLDGKVQWRQDLTDEPQEWIVGAAFEMPLWLRKERGSVQASQAYRAAAEARLQGAEDRAVAELRAAQAMREAAAEQRTWRLEALDRAQAVRELQARSWELGADELFVLLQREQKLAEAGKKAVDATLELAMADLAVRAAVARP